MHRPRRPRPSPPRPPTLTPPRQPTADAATEPAAGHPHGKSTMKTPKPDIDDVKAKFREALDRKRQVHAEGQGKGAHEAARSAAPTGPPPAAAASAARAADPRQGQPSPR